MNQLPEKLTAAYNNFMIRSYVNTDLQVYFRKWLRYYCDFCHKYQKAYDSAESLDAFLDKLAQKNNLSPTVIRHQMR